MKGTLSNQLDMRLYREWPNGKRKKVEKGLRRKQFREDSRTKSSIDEEQGKPLQPEDEEDTSKALDGRVQRRHTSQAEDELRERLAHLLYKQYKQKALHNEVKKKQYERQKLFFNKRQFCGRGPTGRHIQHEKARKTPKE